LGRYPTGRAHAEDEMIQDEDAKLLYRIGREKWVVCGKGWG
jgi:hypothetical protein